MPTTEHHLSLSDEAMVILHEMRADPLLALQRAEDLQARVLRASATADASRASGLISIIHASAQLGYNRYDEAISHLHQALAAAQDIGDLDIRIRALRLLAHAYRATRRHAALARALAQALAAARELNDLRLTVTLMVDAAVARDRLGQPSAALELLDRITDDYHRSRPDTPDWNHLILAGYRAHFLTRLGRPEEAMRELDNALIEREVAHGMMLLPSLLATYAEAMRSAGLRRSPLVLRALADWARDGNQLDCRFRLLAEEAHELAFDHPGAALAVAEGALDEAMPVDGGDPVQGLLQAMSRWAESVGEHATALELSKRLIRELEEMRGIDADAALQLVELELQHATLKEQHAAERTRNTELTAIVDQLTDLQVDVETLVRDAVHDLGGPLTALEFATEGLAQVHGPLRMERSIQYVRSAVASVRDIVSSLAQRQASSSGLPQQRPQQTRLSRMIQHSLPTFEAMAAAKGSDIDCRIEVDVVVAGDPAKVRRVLTNLVSNGIKFSPAGATLIIELKHHDRDVQLIIDDEGPGFPDQFVQTIARERTGPAQPTAGERSEGLGLDIVLRYAREMGATLAFECTARGGCVRVTFAGSNEADYPA